MLQGRTGSTPAQPETLEVSAPDAEGFSADQVRDVAAAAEKADPGVLDRVGACYGKLPEVVKILGGAALSITLGQVARR